MNGVMEICEGLVSIDGNKIKLNKDGCHDTVCINTDKVVAFYCVDGEEGEKSDIEIVTDTHTFYVKGCKGLGGIYADQLEDYLNAPIGVNSRPQGW